MSGGYLSQTFNSQTLRDDFNNFESKQTSIQKIQSEIFKLNRENIASRHLLKSQKYCNCKVLLDNIATTITQLNSLFVLYSLSCWCVCLMKLLMKRAQFINNYQKSTLGEPVTKQFILQSCFLYITEAY